MQALTPKMNLQCKVCTGSHNSTPLTHPAQMDSAIRTPDEHSLQLEKGFKNFAIKVCINKNRHLAQFKSFQYFVF